MPSNREKFEEVVRASIKMYISKLGLEDLLKVREDVKEIFDGENDV